MTIAGRHANRGVARPHGLFSALVIALLTCANIFGLTLPAGAETFAYVFDDTSGVVTLIDTDSQQVVDRRDAGLRIRWFASRFFDGKRVWAVDGDPDKAEIVVFDPWTLTTLKRIPFGKGPSFSVELSPDYRFAIAAAAGSNEVVVIDTSTYAVVRRVPVGQFPCDLTLSADGRLAFEPDRDQDTLSVVDWQTGETVKVIAFEAGSKPHMLTLSPDGKRLWVQERDASYVTVIDARSFEQLARFPVGNGPATNEFDSKGQVTVTTHIGDQVVKVFDAEKVQPIKTIEVGLSPVNSVFQNDGRYVYVTNRVSGTVSIIDANRWVVTRTIKTGKTPFGIYLFDPTLGKMVGNR